jgi:dTDP-4-dehydrorhamnose reductase
MESALIIGGDSNIGRALAEKLSAQRVDCTTTSRRNQSPNIYLDLTNAPEDWPELPTADVAYICAASTKLEECENNPEATRKVNVLHMQMLAERLRNNGSHIIFLSSNQVFDGEKPYRKPTEATCPKNEYGRQKAVFEEKLLAVKSASVLRLTKIVASPLPMLVHWEIALKKGEKVEAFDDLRFAPLPLAPVLTALADMGVHKRSGIFHLSGTHDISYYQIARALAEKLGVDTSLVSGISASTKGILPQFLPRYGTLESSAFSGVAIPDPRNIIL